MAIIANCRQANAADVTSWSMDAYFPVASDRFLVLVCLTWNYDDATPLLCDDITIDGTTVWERGVNEVPRILERQDAATPADFTMLVIGLYEDEIPIRVWDQSVTVNFLTDDVAGTRWGIGLQMYSNVPKLTQGIDTRTWMAANVATVDSTQQGNFIHNLQAPFPWYCQDLFAVAMHPTGNSTKPSLGAVFNGSSYDRTAANFYAGTGIRGAIYHYGSMYQDKLSTDASGDTDNFIHRTNLHGEMYRPRSTLGNHQYRLELEGAGSSRFTTMMVPIPANGLDLTRLTANGVDRGRRWRSRKNKQADRFQAVARAR